MRRFTLSVPAVKKTATVAALSATLFLGGCSQLNRMGANVGLNYVKTYIAPHILSVNDAEMACTSSNSLTPLIVAADAFGSHAGPMGALIYTGAAFCAEERGMAEELRYIRASNLGNVEEALDARTAQKRWYGVGAARQYEAYRLYAEDIEARQKIRIGEDCPKLRTDVDQTIYFLAMLAGVQAITDDVTSGNQVGVPKDIAAKVERSMECLDNNKYWGGPMALRAAIWDLLPGASEGKPDPIGVIKQQTKLGEAQGVRIAHAIYAMAAVSRGDEALIRDAIMTYGKTVGEVQVNPDFALVDTIAGQVVRNIADRYWTENTGHRAPIDNGLTQFWDSAPADTGIDIDLDDIL